MREIKFRAFSKHDQEYVKRGETGLMFYQKTIEDKDGIPELWFVMEKDEDFRYRFEDVFLDDDWYKMQYVGLQDKNGKEAFFGDMYRDKNDCIKVVDSDYDYYQMSGVEADFEAGTIIIGNIYENPKLLKERRH